jgi:hypothetical protein
MSHEVGTDLGMLVRGMGASGYLFDALRTARRTGVGQQRGGGSSRRRWCKDARVSEAEWRSQAAVSLHSFCDGTRRSLQAALMSWVDAQFSQSERGTPYLLWLQPRIGLWTLRDL